MKTEICTGVTIIDYKGVTLSVSYKCWPNSKEWDIDIKAVRIGTTDIMPLLSDRDVENITNKIISEQ